MNFIAATNNPGKMAELRRILERMGHTVQSQREAGLMLDPEENGATFVENARIKAQAICEAAKLPTVADDSGLCVDALDGAPGVYSARYCGHHGDDEANNDKLLKELENVPEGARAARFVSSVCVCLPDGRWATFEGVCPGRIGFVRRGTNGFGYDPLFIPDKVGIPGTEDTVPNTQSRSYAELSADEKDAISHRGRAMARMAQGLKAFLEGENLVEMVSGEV